MQDTVHFFQRRFPSANMVLVRGPQPVLIDTGFGSDIATTEQLLHQAGVPPQTLALVVNTHYHCDHSGGNHALQRRYGLPIAAHRWEAAQINRRAPEACSAEWLGQPIQAYYVDRPLDDGDLIETGTTTLAVVHAPGHTLGQIALFATDERVLICGDAVHGDDVAWINVFREGAGAIDRALHTLDRLAALQPVRAYSGHGPAINDPQAVFDAARHRYATWLTAPQKLGWHACKRIFTYALMLADGMAEPAIAPYLLACDWFGDYSRHVFDSEPADFVVPLLSEMLRSGAAAWHEGRLVARAPYTPPTADWTSAAGHPRLWE